MASFRSNPLKPHIIMKHTIAEIIETKGGEVHSTTPTATAREAVRKMNAAKIGSLLVIHHGEPVGILTERDILVRVIDAGKDPDSTAVHEIMSSSLLTIKPSTGIDDTMKIMTDKRCRHIPVMEGGAVCGLVSIGDLTRWHVRNHEIYIDTLLDYIGGTYPG
ncbi:MAG: CBS domain-containing protein [Puniceicoccaceae bacterium]|nr:MAG: CBS domain-containing protein [Puniceicoccaceae bacterium]